MEVLEVSDFGGTYLGRRVLVTGHTGFKGSWLSLWLNSLGARVSGLALEPTSDPSHWKLLSLPVHDHRVDIREQDAVRKVFAEQNPEIVFHLAAQSLVRESYRDPVTTWATNLTGTMNVLEAVRNTPSIRAAVVITTDKCYENREWPWGYREIDRLGGHDPYSASKACVELLVNSYRSAFMHRPLAPLLATARGGNVIGGGDWSQDRLIPDLVRARLSGKSLLVRSPDATRPWQHVLDCLSGYLLLGQRLLDGDATCAGAWNFGPDPTESRTVGQVLNAIAGIWPGVRWEEAGSSGMHEAGLLLLDSSKARNHLGWSPIWGVEQAVQRSAEWYAAWLDRGEIRSADQLAAYRHGPQLYS